MAYKTIVASLNEIDRVTAVLDVSADIGTELDAHVIGLYVIPGPAVYPAVGPNTVPEGKSTSSLNILNSNQRT